MGHGRFLSEQIFLHVPRKKIGFLQVDRPKGGRYLQDMSTAELAAEKVRGLPELQAQAILTFIEELSTSAALSAAELMRLPPAERRRILTAQARVAEALYRKDSAMIVEETDAPLDYDQGATR